MHLSMLSPVLIGKFGPYGGAFDNMHSEKVIQTAMCSSSCSLVQLLSHQALTSYQNGEEECFSAFWYLQRCYLC